MPGNSFGHTFRITTAGESHGVGNVVIIDGCPPGIPFTEADIQPDLDRRRPGQSKLTTQRQEGDRAQLLAGVFEGRTTGTAIAILIPNEDQRSKDYDAIKDKYRPGHADFTYDSKYGFRDHRGGGRSSARETVARVAAATLAKKILAAHGICVTGYVTQVGHLHATIADPSAVTQADVEANPVRCPDQAMAARMADFIKEVRSQGDSIGGVAEICATGVPPGLGEPVFDKLKADLAKAIFSIPAVTGFEYGSGFAAAAMRGTEHNDIFRPAQGGGVDCASNRHGGMLGGISSGMPIICRASLKPTASLPHAQETVNQQHESTTISTGGRHDPCLLPRFVPVAEAMVALVICDHLLRWRAQCPLQFPGAGDSAP